MSYKQLRPADLHAGDKIDLQPVLEDASFADFAAAHTTLINLAEYQMFEVQDVERETLSTYVLHTSHVSIPLPSDYVLTVERDRR